MNLFNYFFSRTTPQPTDERALGINYGSGQVIHIGGNYNDTGECVTPETVMQIPTVNACVRLISQDMAGLPFHVYKRGPKGRERQNDHWLQRILDNPNEDMDAFSFREAMTGMLLLHGNAYAYIKKVDARPVALLPVSPYFVRLKRNNGQLVYTLRVEGQDVELSPDRVLHIKGFSTDGIQGKSQLEQAANVFGISLSIDKFGAKFFANGMALSGFIRPTGKLTKEAEETLTRTLKENWSGMDNAYRIGVLPANTEWQPVGITPEQGQFNQTKEMQNKELCKIYNVNPIKIGEKGNNSSMEQVEIGHTRGCLRSYAQRWESEVNRKCLLEVEKNSYYVEHELDGMMRGDSNAQDNSFAKGIQNGWYSVNDVRRLKNLPEIDGGDTYLSPLNMTPAQQRPENQPQQKEINPPDNTNAFPVMADVSRRLATKIGNAITRQATKTKELGPWLDEYLREKADVLKQTAAPALTLSHGNSAALAVDNFVESLQRKLVEDVGNAQAFDALDQFTEQLDGTIRQLLEGAN